MKMLRPSNIALYLSAVFLAGAIAGLASGYQWGRRAKPEGPRHRDMTTFLMEKMSHDLTLSSDQQALIAPIISNTTARIRALHRETSKQVEAAMKTSHDEIRPLLDTEQLGKLAEMETRRAKWMRDRGFGPRTNPFSGKAPSKRNGPGSNSLPENLPLSSPDSSAPDKSGNSARSSAVPIEAN